jgi:hypothetical protein
MTRTYDVERESSSSKPGKGYFTPIAESESRCVWFHGTAVKLSCPSATRCSIARYAGTRSDHVCRALRAFLTNIAYTVGSSLEASAQCAVFAKAVGV